MKAVEQEVRVDLRAERLKLGFAGQRAGFGGAALGGAGRLHRQRGVMQTGREQVEQHAHAEERGRWRRGPLEQVARPAARSRQHQADRHCGGAPGGRR